MKGISVDLYVMSSKGIENPDFMVLPLRLQNQNRTKMKLEELQLDPLSIQLQLPNNILLYGHISQT